MLQHTQSNQIYSTVQYTDLTAARRRRSTGSSTCESTAAASSTDISLKTMLMDDGGARERTDVAMEAARKNNNIRRAPRATPGPAPPGHRVDCTPACACPWLRVVQYD